MSTEHKINQVSLDKIRGMLMGCFLGDALGAPHEFRHNKGTKYTGLLDHHPVLQSRWQGQTILPIASLTDDSEMTLALIRSLIRNKGYNEEDVILSYEKWANSGTKCLGKNTRALFKGVTTVKGYKNRFKKQVDQKQLNELSQSNGCLMRCSPLSLLKDTSCVEIDCSLSNPHPVCISVVSAQVSLLKLALQGSLSREDVLSLTKKNLESFRDKNVSEMIQQVQDDVSRDISTNKGWVIHGLWCSLMSCIKFNSFENAMNWVIGEHPRSDTDTNAAIAGALMGALLGYEKMIQEEKTKYNIDKIFEAAKISERPAEYLPNDFDEMCESLYKCFM